MEWDAETYVSADPSNLNYGLEVESTDCPACERLVVRLNNGKVRKIESEGFSYWVMEEVGGSKVIYPDTTSRKVEDEVPDTYKAEYLEASKVLTISPKASAALNRRILQRILREDFQIQKNSLAQEIDAFIERKDTPSYLADAIDAVRNVGNFAAHPQKDLSTGEIVDVEPGEAEWILEVLDSLFDFTFVQPTRLQNRKNNLNSKLQSIGKPPMKG